MTKLVVAILLAFMAMHCGCTKDHVTGKQTFSLIDEDQEVAMGKEHDATIVAEYGLYNDEDLATYVDRLGQSIARVSHRPQLEYHFRVLDDGMLNAFALPGGYVYMPRGILAYFNSEDQLVGVMGHETGHVVARHSVEQMSQRVLFSGFGLTDRLAKAFPVVGGLATAPINIALLKYSRDDEKESDALGVEYSTRTGHDAHHMADFFKLLSDMSKEGGQHTPTFLSTHPDPGDRYTRVNQLADEWQAKIEYTPGQTTPEDYLKRLDGIVYGKDPRQGFHSENMFYHPILKFQFPVPAKWKVANSASRVTIVEPNEKAAMVLGIAGGISADQAADKYLATDGVSRIRRERTTVNGFPATVVESAAGTGKQRTIILSYFIEQNGRVLVFHGFCAEADFAGFNDDFVATMGGVAPVSDRAILDVKPQRVRIKQAPAAGSLKTVLQSLGVDEERLQEIAYLNGRSLDHSVNKGDWIKVVRE